jgi:DNA-binding NtrC family response regulator
MPPPVTPLDRTLEQLERRMIEQALRRARQNKSRAAELLDISRPRLYRRIKELGIPDVPEPLEDAAPAVVQNAAT